MMRVLITLLVVAAVGFGIYVAIRAISQRGRPGGGGFLDYVRNPNASAEAETSLEEWHKAIAELAKEPPERLVEMLLDEEEYEIAERAICEAGPHVVPHLLNAVTQPEFRRRKHLPPDASFAQLIQRSEPLISVLKCLEHYAPPESLPVVAPLVADPNKDIRKNLARLAGSTGADESVPILAKLLTDEEDYVRSSAMSGILTAMKANRASPKFKSGLFDAVKPLVFRRDRTVSGNAPRCLLELNREQAIAFLTDPNNLVSGKDGLQYVLQALHEYEVNVDETLLLKIFSDLKGAEAKHPNDRVLAAALILLAKSPSTVAENAIKDAMSHPSQKVREGAAEALAARSGITDPFMVAFDRLKHSQWSDLSPPQKYVLAVRILIDEVNNGGFLQYFVNSSGDNWPDAAAGLKAIGAIRTSQLLDGALEKFGKQTPSTNRDERHHQLAAVAKSSDRPFAEIEKEFYKDEEDLEVLLLRYISANADDFKR